MSSRPPFSVPPAPTTLNQLDEFAFRQWLANNRVPFNPDQTGMSDYDMRGFWQAQRQGNPLATSAINPNDGRMHYPDYWKTPLHQTFSNESQWAGPDAPHWANDMQLVSPNGRVVFDESLANMTPLARALMGK
jgi:hypothetical protein